MKIDIITLFPDMFKGPFDYSIVKKAVLKGLLKVNIHDLRNWTDDKRKTVDDRPYGGGQGMILMAEPIYKAIDDLKKKDSYIIITSPQGSVFNQKKAKSLSSYKHLVIICGHYEGFDDRILNWVNEEISIGKYILTGGEIPAMVLTDAVCRLIPGVLDSEVVKNESFSNGNNLDYPQFTRPPVFKGRKVPEVLLSGDHKKIAGWRKEQSKKKEQGI